MISRLLPLLLLTFSTAVLAAAASGFSGTFTARSTDGRPDGVTVQFVAEADGSLGGTIIRRDGEFTVAEATITGPVARGRLEPLPGQTQFYSFFAQLNDDGTIMQVTFYFHPSRNAQSFQMEVPHIIFRQPD